jgi:hypothetical protein
MFLTSSGSSILYSYCQDPRWIFWVSFFCFLSFIDFDDACCSLQHRAECFTLSSFWMARTGCFCGPSFSLLMMIYFDLILLSITLKFGLCFWLNSYSISQLPASSEPRKYLIQILTRFRISDIFPAMIWEH